MVNGYATALPESKYADQDKVFQDLVSNVSIVTVLILIKNRAKKSSIMPSMAITHASSPMARPVQVNPIPS